MAAVLNFTVTNMTYEIFTKFRSCLMSNIKVLGGIQEGPKENALQKRTFTQFSRMITEKR